MPFDPVDSDLPVDEVEGVTARTDKSLLKGIKNYLRSLVSLLTNGAATKDAGPFQTVTRTHTSIVDASSTTAVTAVPTSGQKILILDYIISVDTECLLSIEMETSGNDLAAHYMAANSSIQITPRGYLKGDAADKKVHVKTSVAAAVKATFIYASEI
jgi:hypothetical protein